MKNLQLVLDKKEARFMQLLREVEALRITVRLLAEDADTAPSSASVASANRHNASDAQHPSPAQADLDPLADLQPLSDWDRVILDDPAR